MTLLKTLQQAKKDKQKLLAILIDPDKVHLDEIPHIIAKIEKLNAHFILVGGSLLFTAILDTLVLKIKAETTIPVLLFPGSATQISKHADAILFLNLISGRNPEYLISNHVIAAPLLKQTKLEVLSTSYLLVASGGETTASYISNTKPIPNHKPELAYATALAGYYIGHKLIYLDGGSGALNPVPQAMISQIAQNIDLPLIVGGGIRSPKQLEQAYASGADLVVIGTAFEEDEKLKIDL
jgi:putative glycerol-1-phosphate prenyltransferase